MNLFYQYLSPHRFLIAAGVFFKFTATSLDLLIPWTLAYMIDQVVPQNDNRLVFLWGGFMLLFSALSLGSHLVSNRFSSKAAKHFTASLRQELFAKILWLDTSTMDRLGAPSLITRLTSDTYHLHNMINRFQKLGIRAPIMFFGGLTIMVAMNATLGLIFIAILPFAFYITFYLTKKGIPLHRMTQEASDTLVRILRENINGIKIIKVLSQSQAEAKRFSTISDTVYHCEKKAARLMALIHPLMNLIINTGLLAIIFFGARMVNNGTLTAGVIIAFLTYFTMMLHTMMAITRMFSMFSKGAASWNRIASVLSEVSGQTALPSGIQAQKSTRDDRPADASGSSKMRKAVSGDIPHIQFDQVSFSYHPGQPPVLSEISFTLQKGQTLGLIGKTGSGKSTLIKLLLGLYSPQSGHIYINGKSLSEIPAAELYKMTGAVLQENTIFSGTIKDNIVFGRDASQSDLEQAIYVAQAEEFIKKYQQETGNWLTINGQNISGGQKQRVAIARALVSKPDLLIFDDSFSALDYQTDYHLRYQLKKHFAQTTKIIVSQKILTIQDADLILVLNNGHTEAMGSHQELLKNSSSYQDLSQLQLGVS